MRPSLGDAVGGNPNQRKAVIQLTEGAPTPYRSLARAIRLCNPEASMKFLLAVGIPTERAVAYRLYGLNRSEDGVVAKSPKSSALVP